MLKLFKLTWESFRFAAQALRSNLLRTTLSLLGVTIGIFSIIAVYTLVDSLERGIRESVAFLGDDVIYVQKWPWSFGPNYPWWKYVNRPEPDMQDFRFLQTHLESHNGLAVFSDQGGQTIRYRNNSISDANLEGITYEFNKVSSVPIESGRYFSYQETERGRPVAIIGAEIAENLFGGRDPIGQTIKIKSLPFTVVGVMERQGSNLLDAPSVDNNCLIPLPVFSKFFASSIRGSLVIAVKGREEDQDLMGLEGELQGLMRAARGLKPRQEDDFALNRPEMVANQITSIFSVVTLTGTVIGLFSILVGGFGIANIMFVSVRERTNLIGIQKALGAKNYFILFQFLFEAILLSIIGGLTGLLLVFLLTFIPLGSLNVVLTVKNIIVGLAISTVIGVLSGIVPAIIASMMNPVEAIRSS
ncbi:putative ABC transport system permease protein [Catalinimonas alkaloidigena]|uniref:Putative ABC transport system permease protein n=1 Tax=Catalinimonas alkaloidigena TaxID=1075417 RepID=A0A1G9D9F0_9BACT|nr:ABC transporter permease [Catalinimonas alkaloidigena]SDK60529.1 putative ABC transport system permease protein [Catalinimonas alkaloidigena]